MPQLQARYPAPLAGHQLLHSHVLLREGLLGFEKAVKYSRTAPCREFALHTTYASQRMTE